MGRRVRRDCEHRGSTGSGSRDLQDRQDLQVLHPIGGAEGTEVLEAARHGTPVVLTRACTAEAADRQREVLGVLRAMTERGVGAMPRVLDGDEREYLRETGRPFRVGTGRRRAASPNPGTAERRAQASAREQLDLALSALHEQGWVLGLRDEASLGLRADGSIVVRDLDGLRPSTSWRDRVADQHGLEELLGDQGRTLQRRVDAGPDSYAWPAPSTADPQGRPASSPADSVVTGAPLPVSLATDTPATDTPATGRPAIDRPATDPPTNGPPDAVPTAADAPRVDPAGRADPTPRADRARPGAPDRLGPREIPEQARRARASRRRRRHPRGRRGLLRRWPGRRPWTAVALVLLGAVVVTLAVLGAAGSLAGEAEQQAEDVSTRTQEEGSAMPGPDDPVGLVQHLADARRAYLVGESSTSIAAEGSPAAETDRRLRETYRDGSIRGFRTTVHAAEVISRSDDGGNVRIRARLEESATELVTGEGVHRSLSSDGPQTVVLELVEVDGAWRVRSTETVDG